MKINKIEDKIQLEQFNDVELQGCYTDCVEYFQKTKGDWNILKNAGYPTNGKESIAQIREIKNIFGFYCYRKNTPKTCIYF